MEKEINIELYSLYTSGDKGWFVNPEFERLFELNLRSGQCSVLMKEKQLGRIRRFYSVQYKKDRFLYLFPKTKGAILIFDLERKCFRELEISNTDQYNIGVNEVHAINEMLYVVCSGLKKIIVMNQNSILTMYDVQEDIGGYSTVVGSKIYCASYEKGMIIEFDSQNGAIQYYDLPEKMMNIVYDGKKIWLSGYDSYLYVWDYFTHEMLDKIEVPQIVITDSKESKWPIFQKLVSSENYVWAIPYCTNYFVYIHKEENNVKVLEIGEKELVRSSKAWFRFIGVIDDRYLLVSSIKTAKLFQIDMEHATVCEKIVVMQDDVWQAMEDEYFEKGVAQEFYGGTGLCDYISHVGKISEGQKEKGLYINYGKKIYDAVSDTKCQ